MTKSIEILYDEAAIAARVVALAGEIDAAIEGDFTIVGILKGSFVFVADLVRALDARGRATRVDFIRLGSYGAAKKSSGEVRLAGAAPTGIAGRKVLLVDDIVDTGRTLVYAREILQAQGAAKIWTCALADKPSRREVAFNADFVGFTVPDVFIVGYGIDYAEDYRHLRHIGKVD
jgi:hypoxanthine phosphoribosyltransferase